MMRIGTFYVVLFFRNEKLEQYYVLYVFLIIYRLQKIDVWIHQDHQVLGPISGTQGISVSAGEPRTVLANGIDVICAHVLKRGSREDTA